MSYAVIDDVTKRYPPIITMIGSGGNFVASVDVSSIYIQDSESIINAYLARRYVVPLQSEPLLTSLCSDIALYRMIEDKLPRFPDAVEKRYTNAVSMLLMLQQGLISLNSSQLVSSTGDQDAWSNVQSYAGPIFRPAEELTNCGSIFDPLFNLNRSDCLP
jgi:phage gp36-like protein